MNYPPLPSKLQLSPQPPGRKSSYQRQALWLVACCAPLGACAAPPPEPKTVLALREPASFAQLQRVRRPEDMRAVFPLELRLQRGDTLPLDLALSGPLLSAKGTIPVVAQRAMRVRVYLDRPPTVSLDQGQSFQPLTELGGAFSAGVGANKERGPFSTVTVTLGTKLPTQ